MEEVIVVNNRDQVIGTMPKDLAHKNGTSHRIAVTYVENDKGQFLVQVRMSGVLDHSSAGHVRPGESYEQAARRELEEELGIENAVLHKVGHGNTENELSQDGQVRSHTFDIFCCVASPGKLQEDEVKDVYWADPETVLKDMKAERTEIKYAGAFIASLPIYLKSRISK